MSEIFFFICIKSFKLQGAHKGCKGTAKQLAYYVEMTSHHICMLLYICFAGAFYAIFLHRPTPFLQLYVIRALC